MSEIAEFESRLAYTFRKRDLLCLALTHPSYLHDLGPEARAKNIRDNQRLEFLGDAVLSLALADWLYEHFPNLDEGPLSKARAHLANTHALAKQARMMGLGDFILMSRSEEATGGRDRSSILADAFESIIGAIYRDGGYAPARDFILRAMNDDLTEMERAELPAINNPKGELQELLQSISPEPVNYRLESSSGPAHQRVFECSVHHRGEELGRGRGSSKKVAEMQAAATALATLKKAGTEAASSDTAKKEGGE